MIQPSRMNHDIATDASGLQGIGGIYNRQLFAQRIPARHRSKHINYKEMFAILHAFILWHEQWTTGRARIACDNKAVVDAIAKRSIKGPALRPLQTILLIAATFDIEIMIFWIALKENVVADAASQCNFRKLANLGFQDQIGTLQHPPPESKMSTLRRKLHSFFKMPLHQHGEDTTPYNSLMNPTVDRIDTFPILPPPKPSRTGLPKLYIKSNRQRPKHTSRLSAQCITNTTTTRMHSMTPESNLSSGVPSGYMEKGHAEFAFPSQSTFCSKSFDTSQILPMASTSKQHSAWHLPDSYDLVNLHGTLGTRPHRNLTSPESTLHSTAMGQLH